MFAHFPRSFLFFVATAVVVLLQAAPTIVGFFLQMLLAPMWPILLVNGGMIGTAVEAAKGHVSRWWLLLPALFYLGYWSMAFLDRLTVSALRSQYEAAALQVRIPFEPSRDALVLDNPLVAESMVQNYNLRVAYTVNSNYPGGFLAHRIADRETCDRIRGQEQMYSKAGIRLSAVVDGEVGYGRRDDRFCDISMPEVPTFPVVRLATHRDRIIDRGMPVYRVVHAVSLPDGHSNELIAATTAPLHPIPMPIIGCGGYFRGSLWGCTAYFKRAGSLTHLTPRTAGGDPGGLIARAIGLTRIPIANRESRDLPAIHQRIAEAEAHSAGAGQSDRN